LPPGKPTSIWCCSLVGLWLAKLYGFLGIRIASKSGGSQEQELRKEVPNGSSGVWKMLDCRPALRCGERCRGLECPKRFQTSREAARKGKVYQCAITKERLVFSSHVNKIEGITDFPGLKSPSP
jgi:hypothetical protein